MQTSTVRITASKAHEFLNANLPFERGAEDTNRPVSLRRVNEYALEMLKGNWKHTHQGIGFDKKGHLKDGQHRLLALVQAAEEGAMEGDIKYDPNPKIAINFQVTYGLETDVFDRLDVGLARSSNQILAMAGYPQQLHLAAAARLLYLYQNHDFGHWSRVKVTNRQILDTVQETSLNEYITVVTKLTTIGLIASAATVGYYVCERAMPTGPHEEFISELKDGIGLAGNSPTHVLREYLIRSKGSGKIRREAHIHLALYIKASNDYILGMKRSAISWRKGEDFPEPTTGGK